LQNDAPEGALSIHARIKVRMSGRRFPESDFPVRDDKNPDAIVLKRSAGRGEEVVLVETSLGRLLFTEAFPADFAFRVEGTQGLKKRAITEVIGDLVEEYPRAFVAESLDNLKDLGFRFATRSGLTIAISDVKTPPQKAAMLETFEAAAAKIEGNYDKGLLTDEERKQLERELWSDATDEVAQAMEAEMSTDRFNPIEMMVGSGARGNAVQVRQIAGMRGLVANPRGEIIPRPIKSNFREGLSVLEYFVSTHGARKGLADTALRTADSGYLTRRLVDVAQEVIVRDEDCESTRGIMVENVLADGEAHRLLETSLQGRCLAEDVTLTDGTVYSRNIEIREDEVEVLANDPSVTSVKVRSVLTCDSISGICALCYGTMLANGKISDLGEAVGIIAAQSIGEPGTQLTMRTFHTGGAVQSSGGDITHGLPRVVELFEARDPKGSSILSESSGVVRLGDNEKGDRIITVVADDGTEEIHIIARRAELYPGGDKGPKIEEGTEVEAGNQLTGNERTPLDPKKVLQVRGIRETQQYLSDEVQRVYREQGVSIHDKHVEVIVRQMLRRVGVSEPGDSNYLPGQKTDARAFAETNRRLVAEGKRPAEGRPELMGITKASLATDSWLSAASFQETTRVLTEAAIEGRNDSLFGLKENVIIGKLIPAGTGMPVYREIDTLAPDYKPLPFYSSELDAEEMAQYLLETIGTAEAEVAVVSEEVVSSELRAVPDIEVTEVVVDLEGTGTDE
jgi:DNA-directed RNA polymerase subunit beta'